MIRLCEGDPKCVLGAYHYYQMVRRAGEGPFKRAQEVAQ